MDIMQKLAVLGESARYDVSCSSSGSARTNQPGGIGNASLGGICHTWTADGRCVSLLKVLLTNECIYDCAYCGNRCSNDLLRAKFEPQELADLTIAFYRRNYIEGLFLSSGVWRSPDETMEHMIRTLQILRHEYSFNGYIHAKAIPGAADHLLEQLGLLADRVSINIEQCTKSALSQLAPQKTAQAIYGPMNYLTGRLQQRADEMVRYRHAPQFAPAGQSTQIIIGASVEKDLQILHAAEKLYRDYRLKRVYYSAYMPVNADIRLPALSAAPPLLREHRLYQADWLLRFYRFSSTELLDPARPDLDLEIDPKAAWALRHLDQFPLELNQADYEMLLRVPGFGVRSVQKIIAARRWKKLRLEDLRTMKISLKRAGWFVTCQGKYGGSYIPSPEGLRMLMTDGEGQKHQMSRQISLDQYYAYPV